MALTMTDEQERAHRKRLASPHVLMSGECFCANCGAIAFKCELDATRAALAQAHAEAAALREAGKRALLCCHLNDWEATELDMLAHALSRAPGSREALRAMLTRAARDAWTRRSERAGVVGAQNETLLADDCAAIVSRLLEGQK